jgi:catechol 2,3-dioxygenase-like lactoylglutathione lyase family enzyme
VRFYRDALGFEEQTRHTGKGGPSAMMLGTPNAALAAVFLERDGVIVELQTIDGDDPSVITNIQRGLSHIGFKVDDLDGVIAQLEAAGASVIRSSRFADDELGSEVVFVTDPDGTRIELISAPDAYDIWRGDNA